MASHVITLTSDFGAGEYAASMKGAALTVNPDATLVDVSHDVPPQDVAHGAFVLGSCYRTFPEGTIHVAVVDPGVGGPRRPLLLVTPDAAFVGPDNGIFSYVLRDYTGVEALGVEGSSLFESIDVAVPAGCQAFVLGREEYWRHPVSATFHGRDIFAPVAAHLSLGVAPDAMGREVYELTALNVPAPSVGEDEVRGLVVHVDGFGNLVTNIRAECLPRGKATVEAAGVRIDGISRTYSDGDGLMALVGSHGYLEVAESNGSAAARLGGAVGVEVVCRGEGVLGIREASK